jgi:hypothetical protein
VRYTRKRTDDDLRVLAGYAVRDPQTGAVVGVLDQLIGVTPELRAAWGKAEEATVAVLRGAIVDLAETWGRFGQVLPRLQARWSGHAPAGP